MNQNVKTKRLLRCSKLSCVAITATLFHTLSHAQQWIMHRVDPDPASNIYAGYNSVNPGDFDQDGDDDFLVIHEFGNHRGLTLIMNPGASSNALYDYWEKVPILETSTNEYGQVGDFDNDGRLDIVSLEGSETSAPSQIRIIWGPAPSEIRNPSSWVTSDPFPAYNNVGNPLWSEVKDIDNDGDLDIFVTSRINPQNGSKIGISWMECPNSDRRNISNWTERTVDANINSGHGFKFVDVDDDGDEDILVNSADFDTPNNQAQVIWYENVGGNGVRNPWPKHVVDTDVDYFAKCRVDAADLDGDGMTDIVCPLADDKIFFFKKTSNNPVTFQKITINKTGPAVQLQRFIEIVDINQDGKKDLLCGSLYYFSRNVQTPFPFPYGYVEPQKYMLYWMEFTGSSPGSNNWNYHPIKLSFGSRTNREWRGEKIDHVRVRDMDNDGDLDIICNSEESFVLLDGDSSSFVARNNSNAIHTFFGVAWFENTAKTLVASDNFESNHLSGGSGWSGNWSTSSQADVVSNGLQGTYRARLRTTGTITRTLSEPIDDGQLEFRWFGSSWDNKSETAEVQVFDGAWHTLRTYYQDEDDDGVPYHNEMLALTKFGPITQIRFKMNGSGSGDFFYVDDIKVFKKSSGNFSSFPSIELGANSIDVKSLIETTSHCSTNTYCALELGMGYKESE